MEPGGTAPAGQRFAVDRTLGRLARWLRVLGHDVAYGAHLGGPAILTCARRERRLLLTRNTRLCRSAEAPPHLLVTSNDFRQQLREVAAAVPLATGARFRRCLRCNRLLEDVPRQAAAGRVPPFVWETTAHFLGCPHCGRLYWPATHRDHMQRELAALGLARPDDHARPRA
jgi:uncharacterized protein with PIN domain